MRRSTRRSAEKKPVHPHQGKLVFLVWNTNGFLHDIFATRETAEIVKDQLNGTSTTTNPAIVEAREVR